MNEVEVALPGHDVIVIGASAGGLKALSAVVSELPADLGAAVFIVQHLSPDRKSELPKLLADVSDLPASHPADGETFHEGHIYVAPPDHHLLINEDSVRVVRGPQENRFRPSIDALFRSAARAHGPRVIGMVMTGYLDDGTVGLQAISKQGGITVVQDPDEAEYPSMPRSALRYVNVDHSVPIAEAGALLLRLVGQEPAPRDKFPTSLEIEIEAKIAEQEMNTKEYLENVRKIGNLTSYTCPDCNGSIWQIGNDEPIKFRCHVGHSFTGDVFSTEQTQNLENALWSAIRIMEEKVTFARQMADRRRGQKKQKAADSYDEQADGLDREVTSIRDLIACGIGTQRAMEQEDG